MGKDESEASVVRGGVGVGVSGLDRICSRHASISPRLRGQWRTVPEVSWQNWYSSLSSALLLGSNGARAFSTVTW